MESNVRLKIDAIDNSKAAFAGLQKSLSGVNSDVSKVSGGFGGLTKSLAGVAATYFSVSKIFEAAQIGLTVAADMQTAEVGLKTLLGSGEKARETIDRLKQEAARTPFELPGLTQAVQLLSSVTKDGNKSIDIILDIGEGLAAMGKGQAELDRIIVNLQQIAAVGKAASIDIKQFAFAGIPIYEMLTEATGKSGEALETFINEGGVTFDVLTQMFDKANDAGGRFHNAFVNQAGTFNQAASNMKDSFGIMLSDMVNSSGLFQGITDAMMGSAGAMSSWRDIIEASRNRMAELFTLFDEKTLLITHLKGAFDNLVGMFKEILKPAIDEIWLALQPLMPYLEALGVVIAGGLVIALHTLIAAFQVIAGVVAAALSGIASFTTFIIDSAVYAFRTLQNAVEFVAAVFTGDWGGAIEAVKNQIADLVDWVGDLIDMFERAIDLAKDIGGGSIDFIKNVLPGRATGGPVTAGRPYMVGEAGPELLIPRQNSTIVPNGALAGYGAGGGHTINLYISGTFMDDRSAAKRLSDQIMGDLRTQLKL